MLLTQDYSVKRLLHSAQAQFDSLDHGLVKICVHDVRVN